MNLIRKWFGRITLWIINQNTRNNIGLDRPFFRTLKEYDLWESSRRKIGCFVVGLIKSMRETPEKWSEHNVHFHYGYACYVREASDQVWVYHDVMSHTNGKQAYVANFDISEQESKELSKAILAIKANRFKVAVQRQQERLARLRAPFESLGCSKKE